MGLGLFEVGEWPSNRNNGLCIFDVGPRGDGGVPFPVNPTAKVKDRIGPDHSSRLEFRFCHCLMPPHALALWLATRQRTEQNRMVARCALIALPQLSHLRLARAAARRAERALLKASL